MTEEPTQAQPLKDAPADAPATQNGTTAETPMTYSVRVFARSKEGFEVELQSDQTTKPMQWLNKQLEGLKALGMEPVDRYPAPQVAASVSPVSGGDGDEATLIAGEGGKPPRCSVHGPLNWLEGDRKDGKGKYAFWACKNRDCKVKSGSG